MVKSDLFAGNRKVFFIKVPSKSLMYTAGRTYQYADCSVDNTSCRSGTKEFTVHIHVMAEVLFLLGSINM